MLRYLVRRVETVPLSPSCSATGTSRSGRAILPASCSATSPPSTACGRCRSHRCRSTAWPTAVDGTGLDPARVHALTGGNPFYVAQVALEPDRPLPTSVRDTVLARIAEIEPEDLEILQLIACSPDRLDDRVLPMLGVDLEVLRRLGGTTLLTHTDQGIAFRHELARQAVDSTIPPGGAPRLHQRLLSRSSRSSRWTRPP